MTSAQFVPYVATHSRYLPKKLSQLIFVGKQGGIPEEWGEETFAQCFGTQLRFMATSTRGGVLTPNNSVQNRKFNLDKPRAGMRVISRALLGAWISLEFQHLWWDSWGPINFWQKNNDQDAKLHFARDADARVLFFETCSGCGTGLAGKGCRVSSRQMVCAIFGKRHGHRRHDFYTRVYAHGVVRK